MISKVKMQQSLYNYASRLLAIFAKTHYSQNKKTCIQNLLCDIHILCIIYNDYLYAYATSYFMLLFIVNILVAQQSAYFSIEHLEIPGQRSEVRRSATPSSSISPVSDRTDSSIQHKKVAVDIQGAGKESRIDCVILYVSRCCSSNLQLLFWEQLEAYLDKRCTHTNWPVCSWFVACFLIKFLIHLSLWSQVIRI